MAQHNGTFGLANSGNPRVAAVAGDEGLGDVRQV